ncbi:MAG: PIN domain-containing protein [Sphingomonadales bacterium]|nr:PIN domain-containing protein [Sphingomonadales bacterium]
MIALDTNILIYAITDDDAEGRHQLACDILLRIGSGNPILPLPVVGEYLNVCRMRKQASFTAALERADRMIRNYNCIPALPSDYLRAGTTSYRYRIQYFDALIIMVAIRAGASILLSEDMQDGLEVEGLRVVNPFLTANEILLADYLGSFL